MKIRSDDLRDIPGILLAHNVRPDEKIRVKIPVSAGLLSRGALRRALDSWDFVYSNTSVSYTESKGILFSSFFIVVEGPASEVDEIARKISQMEC